MAPNEAALVLGSMPVRRIRGTRLPFRDCCQSVSWALNVTASSSRFIELAEGSLHSSVGSLDRISFGGLLVSDSGQGFVPAWAFEQVAFSWRGTSRNPTAPAPECNPCPKILLAGCSVARPQVHGKSFVLRSFPAHRWTPGPSRPPAHNHHPLNSHPQRAVFVHSLHPQKHM